MKIAIFGGRFDPIHNGHLAVAQEVLHMGGVDEVWLSIENQHQWRPIVASWQDRKNMVKLAVNNERDSSASPQNDIFKIDLTPVELGGMTETISVMRRLRKKYSQHEFFFVIGSDNLDVFDKWTHKEELEKEVHFLVVTRKNFPITKIPKNVTVIIDPNYIPLEDSATRIREFIKAGKSITGLVPKAVEEYIKEHELYR